MTWKILENKIIAMQTVDNKLMSCLTPEVESSRTQFEVLGLEDLVLGVGLEACKSSKMPCPRLEDKTIF